MMWLPANALPQECGRFAGPGCSHTGPGRLPFVSEFAPYWATKLFDVPFTSTVYAWPLVKFVPRSRFVS